MKWKWNRRYYMVDHDKRIDYSCYKDTEISIFAYSTGYATLWLFDWNVSVILHFDTIDEAEREIERAWS